MKSQGIIVRIQNKGLITIPKPYREKLRLEKDGLVRVKQNRGSITIEPIRTLSYPVRSYTDTELNEFVNLDAKESKNLKKSGLL